MFPENTDSGARPAGTVPPTTPLTRVDNLHAPEIFASLLADVSFDGPNVRISFASNRFNPATGAVDHDVINLRVVMSLQSAAQAAKFLLDRISAANLAVTPVPSDQPMQ